MNNIADCAGALKFPSNYVPMDAEEMEYLDGGWSGQQVLKNVTGIIAVFSLGYAGSAFQKFVAANKGLGYVEMLAKCGTTLWNFIKVAPLQLKLIIGVCTAATLYALGQWDIF